MRARAGSTTTDRRRVRSVAAAGTAAVGVAANVFHEPLQSAPCSGVEWLLERARARLRRVQPWDLSREIAGGGVLVDIRSESQRASDGEVAGAIAICRNVLEWRCDPASPFRDARVSQPQRRVIVLCNEGFQSSLAAAALLDLGLERATDVVGGFQALWREQARHSGRKRR
jgi:rhodanese-related sulfurtransferase